MTKRFALTDRQLATVRATDKRTQLTDGQGLYLKLQWVNGQPAGNGHQWRFDYTRPTTGKRNTLSLGAYPAVTLAQARERAQEARAQVAQGIDPGEVKERAQAAQKAAAAAAAQAQERAGRGLAPAGTLRGVCEDYHGRNVRTGKWTALHAEQWLSMLERHVFRAHPAIAGKPVEEVRPADVLAILEPIEAAGMGPSAAAVRKYLTQVFNFAMVVMPDICRGNPAHAVRAVVKSDAGRGHNAAVVTEADLRRVLDAIQAWPTPITRAALWVQVTCFQRPGNTATMRWAHLDLDAALWVIPAAEMKGDRTRKTRGADHAVPLPRQIVALLRGLQPLSSESGWVFESPAIPGRPITNDTMTLALGAMGLRGTQSAHGFRATARTMLRERLGVNSEVIEAHLAHIGATVGLDGTMRIDALGGAYNRATHLDERRSMAQRWADYLDALVTRQVPAVVAAPVVLRAA